MLVSSHFLHTERHIVFMKSHILLTQFDFHFVCNAFICVPCVVCRPATINSPTDAGERSFDISHVYQCCSFFLSSFFGQTMFAQKLPFIRCENQFEWEEKPLFDVWIKTSRLLETSSAKERPSISQRKPSWQNTSVYNCTIGGPSNTYTSVCARQMRHRNC